MRRRCLRCYIYRMEKNAFNHCYHQYLDEAVARTRSRLSDPLAPEPDSLQAALAALLAHFEIGRPRKIAALALASPFFPATLLWRGMLQGGYKFKYPPKNDLSPQQILVEKGLRYLILLNEFKEFYPGQVLSVSFDRPEPDPAALPDNQWCDYCGLCCAMFGGVAPMAPKGATYPAHWLDDIWQYQYWCPFLFEYHRMGRFFCAIHNIKPVWCTDFADQNVCRQVKESFSCGRLGRQPDSAPLQPGEDGTA
ncbi:MAG: hypothetical protein V2A77_06060 [Pseudomonadota bacterium]